MISQLSSASRIHPASPLPCAVPFGREGAEPESAPGAGFPERFAVLASAAVAGLCLAAVIAVSACWHGLYLDARADVLDSTLGKSFAPAAIEVPDSPVLPRATVRG